MIYAAILGFGVVGSGTAQVLEQRKHDLDPSIGLKYILDLREFPDSPFRSLLVRDFGIIEQDPEVSVVIETIGGVGAAYEFTRRSLMAGKSVVTSNKELVATHGPELMALAKEHGCAYLFEASVGGGIPVLGPIQNCLSGGEITQVRGIINGTTNYILTRMLREGAEYEAVLKDAQALGYAERDPSADVDGLDAGRKISILASLCFGHYIHPDTVSIRGIREIRREDTALLGEAGYELKLLGRSYRQGERIAAYVAPHAVPRDSLLASIHGVTNAVEVLGKSVGSVLFAGPGAGSLPTASAVVGDVIELSRHPGAEYKPFWTRESAVTPIPEEEIAGAWILRVAAGTRIPETELLASQGGYDALLTRRINRRKMEEITRGATVFAAYRVLD